MNAETISEFELFCSAHLQLTYTSERHVWNIKDCGLCNVSG